MTDTTSRLALPLLDAGQAQKEVTHNEALARLDLAVQAVVLAIGLATPPAMPVEGQAWIVGDAPTGDWAAQPRAIAGWTGGGWRFVAPFEGLCVWSVADGLTVRVVGGVWVAGMVSARQLLIGGVPVVGSRRSAIAGPSGGTTIDSEARSAISTILDALRGHGLIAS